MFRQPDDFIDLFALADVTFKISLHGHNIVNPRIENRSGQKRRFAAAGGGTRRYSERRTFKTTHRET